MPRLFSYGDLQREPVQLETFGRRMHGRPDEVLGWEASEVPITDPRVAADLGRTHHRNLRSSGMARTRGTVFDVTDAELARIDGFEARFDYRRVTAKLASGGEAWVYVHAGGV